ncbi:MAG: YqgE/AlgH family protein [Xanthomonadales bacterium]|nr:YqgE/AlgH family protein [Xanthomonadales bacterium]
MQEGSYLNGHFLIAMPGLKDPNFEKGVTFLCQHNESGALGITINRSADLQISEVLAQLDIECDDQPWCNQPVLIGGPVQRDRGFVLHELSGEWNSSIQVSEDLALTTSKDILEALARGEGPQRALLALGYAGWAPGQLEREIRENSWLSGPGDAQIIFDAPMASRWSLAAEQLGVDIAQLTGFAGHA